MHTIADSHPRHLACVRPPLRVAHTHDLLDEPQTHAELLSGFTSAIPFTLHQAIEIARRFFKADAAGIYLLAHEACGSAPNPDVITGVLSMHETAQPSLGLGLCKRALNAATAMVLSEQEIELSFLRHLRPRIAHVLMAPIYDGEKRPMGTIWLAQTTSTATYSRTDALALERLTYVFAVGLTVINQAKELEKLLSTTKLEHQARYQGGSKIIADLEHEHALRTLRTETSRRMVNSELAIREAHHRVKNTLQIVNSLLALQAHTTNQTETRSALHEASARLQLLTHAHEYLYEAASGCRDICVDRLLRLIADTLPRSFAETSVGVRLQLNAAEILMPPAEASTLALIANEILTNAYKHAFPNHATGAITIDLERDPESFVILRIADTGIGCGLQVDPDNFGLMLVRRLAEQLGATVDYSNLEKATGTVFTVRVPPIVTDPLHASGAARTVDRLASGHEFESKVIHAAPATTSRDPENLSSVSELTILETANGG